MNVYTTASRTVEYSKAIADIGYQALAEVLLPAGWRFIVTTERCPDSDNG